MRKQLLPHFIAMLGFGSYTSSIPVGIAAS